MPGDKIYTDPSTIPPKEPPRDYTGEALEIEAQKVQVSAQDSQTDADVKKYEIDTDSADKRYQTDVNAQMQLILADKKGESSLTLEGTRAALKNAPIELGNQRIQETGEAVTELKAMLMESVLELRTAVQEVKDTATAPRKLIKENGKIVGAEVNGQVIRLEQ